MYAFCSEPGQIRFKDFLNMCKLEKEKFGWITAPNTDGKREPKRLVHVGTSVHVCLCVRMSVGEYASECVSM